MKELPYFKFSPIEYINADISFCSYEVQGLFTQIESFFWTRNCQSIPLEMLKQKFSNATNLLEILLDKRILKTDKNGIYVDFLREQFLELNSKHKSRVKAGSLGGKAKAKGSNALAMLEVCSSNKEEDKDKIKKKNKETFNIFWDYFHKTTKTNKSDKEPAFKYWVKLSLEEQRNAYKYVKPYYESLKDKKYCKKARTYLSDKNFNDEFKNEEMSMDNFPDKYRYILNEPINNLTIRQRYDYKDDPELIKWAQWLIKHKQNELQQTT